MIYSSADDLEKLIQKLRQVAEMGCRSFALLFDDIESTMNEAEYARDFSC